MSSSEIESHTDDDRRGRQATKPEEIPAKGWMDILRRVFREIGEDNLTLVAAGVAFYALLAIFPAIAAFVSIYGLLVDPAEVAQQMARFTGILPEDTRAMLMEQVQRIGAESEATLSFSAIAGTLFALWSASKGAQAMLTACNITYDEDGDRNFFQKIAWRMAFTLGSILLLLVAIAVIAILPIVLKFVGFSETVDIIVAVISWPLLAVVFNVALAILYRFGPDRSRAEWRWVSYGSIIATALWILASLGFTFYVSNFGSYNETYGSLGGVVVLLMWLWLSAFIVLFGAELNAEIEHQTAKDSTTGPEKPMGERGAYVADTVGKSY